VTATAVNQVVPSPTSKLAFITFDGSGGQLPYYIPGSGMSSIALTGTGVTSPLFGAFSPDDTYFFVGTGGDNMVHYITIPPAVTSTALPADSQQVAPGLPTCTPVASGGTDLGCTYTGTGSVAPVTAITVKPRSTT
jgi:hypothetical protein